MDVTILVDNTALFDRYFIAEHGFSAYIELKGAGYCSIPATPMRFSKMRRK